MDIFHVFRLLGGLAMFLFGMDTMSKSLQKQAGGKLQKILGAFTGNPLKGFLLGMAVTAVIQSSGATTVMVVGFVNSGVMTLQQAIGVILGSNVGTTVTAWILSLDGVQGTGLLIEMLKPANFSPILAFLGIVLYTFCKSERKKGVGTILIGFGLLMIGMDNMSSAMAPLEHEAWFLQLFAHLSNPILGVLAGALLTTVMQSSSASVGVLQALSGTGAITFGNAVPMIMGQNIGSCTTALLSSIGANKSARRTAMVHLYFNVIGSVVFLVLFYTLDAVFHFSVMEEPVDRVRIALVHTGFNLAATAFMLPLSKWLEKLAVWTIPDSAAEPEQVQLLDSRLLATPAAAVDRSFSTTADMADLGRQGVNLAIGLMHKWDEKKAAEVERLEAESDRYEDAIGTYLVQLSSRSMNVADSHLVNTLLHTISDFERISDHARDLTRTAQEIHQKKVVFSKQAQEELLGLEAALGELLSITVNCFRDKDLSAAHQVEPLEQVIDDLVRKIKMHHVARLKDGSCSIEYGFVLEDLLTGYERIADHCSNVAVAMIEVAEGSFDTHQYLTGIKNGGNDEFDLYYGNFRTRYRLEDERKSS